MDIPQSLKNLIENATEAVYNHPKNDLNLGYRQAIWAEFGPLGDESGLKKRTVLAKLTIEKVFPMWKSAFPDDNTPRKISKEVDQILDGSLSFSPEDASEHVRGFWEWIEDIEASDDELTALNVGFGFVKLITTALFDELFDSKNIDYDCTDADVDSYDSDCSYYAAAAYSNGTVWDEDSDASKRKKFWEWWLKEAVPEAWKFL
jgi:hypothetical protein